jgi:hypothetical protein
MADLRKALGQVVGTESGLSENGGKTRVRRKKLAAGPASGRQLKQAKDLRYTVAGGEPIDGVKKGKRRVCGAVCEDKARAGTEHPREI